MIASSLRSTADAVRPDVGDDGRTEAEGSEIEIKLATDQGSLARLNEGAPLVDALRPARSSQLTAIYFDTKDFALVRHGVALRIRFDGKTRTQTAKSLSGIVARDEWEMKVASDGPDLSAVPPVRSLRILKKGKVRRRLRPVFATDVKRRTFHFERGGSELEIAVDTGSIRAGDRTAPVGEIEIELRKGTHQALFDVVRGIHARVPSILSLTTKSEVGYQLAATQPGAAARERTVCVTRNVPVAEALKLIGRGLLANLFDEANRLAERRSVEAVHRARVNLRRVRAFWQLFRPVLENERSRAVRQDLKWISDCLGALRDLDVFQATVVEPALARSKPIKGLDAVVDLVERQGRECYDRVVEALRSQRFLDLGLLLIERFEGLEDEADRAPKARRLRKKPVCRYLRAAIEPRLRTLCRNGRRIRQLDSEEQHKVRIEAKKLRYVLEPFGGLAGRRVFRDTNKHLAAMQDALGAANDWHRAGDLAATLASSALDARDGKKAAKLARKLVPSEGRHHQSRAVAQACRHARRLSAMTPVWHRW